MKKQDSDSASQGAADFVPLEAELLPVKEKKRRDGGRDGQQTVRFQTVVAVAVPVVLALALAGVCIWSSEEQRRSAERAQTLETMVQSGYRQAFYELSDNVNGISTALKKLRVTASSARHILLLADVWRLSGAAVASMGNVPNAHVDAYALNSFLVRVGDYAHVLTQRILAGGVLMQEDYEQLDALYEASVKIGGELSNRIASDDFPLQSLDADNYYSAADAGGGEEQEDRDSISDYPTLIYDGPFSESNEETQARGLSEGEIDEAAARQKALDYLGGGALTGSGAEDGVIPVYGFFGKDGSGRNVELTVTKQGGAVLWMMAETAGGEDGVPDEKTVQTMRDAAKAFLDAHKYSGMEATYAQFYDGVGVFNFAATQDGVILYNDLIKVYVERASGAVCGVDANNYLMMHKSDRVLPQAQLTREEAQQCVSESLEVASVRLALIPKTASTETLCYEFKGTCRGSEFIVYVNAASGAEEEIFEIINAEDGQLVV